MNPLNIYVAWSQKFSKGRNYANSIYTHFCNDINNPFSRGIGIPVYFRTGETLLPINLEIASNNVVIVLIDDEMVIDEEWRNYVGSIHKQVLQNKNSLILPIAITKNALNISNKISKTNFIRLYESEDNNHNFLLAKITHELCRMLYGLDSLQYSESNNITSPKPVKLFISHAKEDGVDISEKLNKYIQNKSTVKTFFDANDIAPGYDFTKEIEENIKDSVLLVVHSDKYSSREWCRREILMSKKYKQPIVVINIYEEGEERSFPYMGNVNIVRFNNSIEQEKMFEKIIFITLKETLKFKYQESYLKYLVKKYSINKVGILGQPPELLTILELSKEENELILYPDPPLGIEEIEFLSELTNEDKKIITPIYIPLLHRLKELDKYELSFLEGLNIGLSISESQNINEFGFDQIHLRDILVEISRHILASGASLSYGGDVRYNDEFNFAKILFDLARIHQKENNKPDEKITNYTVEPIYSKINSKVLAELQNVAKFIKISPPKDLENKNKKISKELQENFIWSRNLTKMRQEMNENISARVFIGGKTTGFKGKFPGIVEEAYLAIQSEKPVFLIGAFGGATKVIIDSVRGEYSEELLDKYLNENKKYRIFCEQDNNLLIEEGEEIVDFKSILELFEKNGIEGLNNGLSKAENIKLFETQNITEIISLILKGLLMLKNNRIME